MATAELQEQADLEAIAEEFWAALGWDDGDEAERAFNKAVFEGSV